MEYHLYLPSSLPNESIPPPYASTVAWQCRISTIVEGIRVCQKAGCTIGRAWQRWGGRTQKHVLVESLLVLYLCVSSLSPIDTRKTVPMPIRGLVTNWPYHTILA